MGFTNLHRTQQINRLSLLNGCTYRTTQLRELLGIGYNVNFRHTYLYTHGHLEKVAYGWWRVHKEPYCAKRYGEQTEVWK